MIVKGGDCYGSLSIERSAMMGLIVGALKILQVTQLNLFERSEDRNVQT